MFTGALHVSSPPGDEEEEVVADVAAPLALAEVMLALLPDSEEVSMLGTNSSKRPLMDHKLRWCWNIESAVRCCNCDPGVQA